MICRPYTPEDYATVTRWWESQKINCVPQAMLPMCGIVVERDAVPVGVVWAYMDNSVGVAFMAYPTVSPDVMELMIGPVVAERMIGCMEQVLKSHGYSIVVITTAVPALAKLLKRGGFSECHANTWEGMKVLK